MLLILIAMLPIAGLTVYSSLDLRQAQADASKAEALRLARSAAATHASYVEGARQLLITLSLLPEVRSLDGEACSRRLAEMLKGFPQYANLAAVRPDGDIYCSALILVGRVNVADRSWFQRAVKTRAFASGDYQIGRITGRASINSGYPVFDNSGRISAIAMVALDLRWLSELGPTLGLPEGVTLTVIDRNGTILTRHPDPAKWVGKALPDALIVKAILEQRHEGTTETSGVDGIRRLYAFTPLVGGQGTVAYLYVGIPSAVAFALANLALSRGLAALAMVAAGAMAVAWLVASRSIVRDVNRLADVSRHWAVGDLDVRTGIPAGGEIGHLARAFDRMAGSLKETTVSRDALLAEVAQRRRAEEKLAEGLAEVQSVNKELDGFAYSVAHDLRAPLRAIDGFSRILVEDHATRLDGEGKRVLDVIRGNTQRMAQLIDDILAYSRMGRLEFRFADISMEDLARSAFEDLRQPDRAIRFDLGPLPPARGDRAVIRQVWDNLLSNAVKFTRPREQAVIEVRGRIEDHQAVYSVRDNGVGFDTQYAGKLFGVFQRLHRQDEFEGTGVGLAIAHRVVHRHGGRIWAEGRLNEGATFHFSLPTGGDGHDGS